ncbi:hypothetical protein HID58_067315 [Brassica napus]|uniref:Gnk2-homologous domain-containing protein n=1 Tax=Brassica napus TaxID=3708 RepID=A0ABQ7ZIQ6_BRANA|nr:hypothetical protein HID58_067315 [Brassica napus]
MYSSSSVSKRLILIYVLAIQLLLINSELSLNTTNDYLNHTCLVSQGKYKTGSEYEKLIKHIMKMFYINSIRGYDLFGDSTFTAVLQCRGDSYGTKCRDCFVTALAAKRYKGGDMVYGMVQCAKDLSRKACQECLWYNSFHFQDCVNYFRGARVVGRSCTFRFEFYPFIAKQVHNI